MVMPDGYVTVREASETTGIPVMTIYKMVNRKTIPSVEIGNRRIGVDISGISVRDKGSYMTIAEAARKWGVSISTINSGIQSGRIPSVRGDNFGKFKRLIPCDYIPVFIRDCKPEYKKKKLSDRHINVQIGNDLWEELEECAKDAGVKRSVVVRDALMMYLKGMDESEEK